MVYLYLSSLIFTFQYEETSCPGTLTNFPCTFFVLQTNLNKAVNIFCTLPEWIRNIEMIQCFLTIRTWMRILHD